MNDNPTAEGQRLKLEFMERIRHRVLSEHAADQEFQRLAIELYFSVIEEEIRNPGFGVRIKEFLEQWKGIADHPS